MNILSQFNTLKIFETWQSLESPSSTPGGETRAPTEFFVGNLILNNFYLKHFSI